jgi:hypothetical protein
MGNAEVLEIRNQRRGGIESKILGELDTVIRERQIGH